MHGDLTGRYTEQRGERVASRELPTREGLVGVTEWDTSGLSGFSLDVLRARALLALRDPAGEWEAVAPLDVEQATYNWIAAEVALARSRPPQLTAESSYLGDLGTALALPVKGHGLIRCPAHEDGRESLSWRWDNGFLLLHCFAGCTFDEIREAVL